MLPVGEGRIIISSNSKFTYDYYNCLSRFAGAVTTSVRSLDSVVAESCQMAVVGCWLRNVTWSGWRAPKSSNLSSIVTPCNRTRWNVTGTLQGDVCTLLHDNVVRCFRQRWTSTCGLENTFNRQTAYKMKIIRSLDRMFVWQFTPNNFKKKLLKSLKQMF